MSHRKSDLGIPRPRKSAKVVLSPKCSSLRPKNSYLHCGIFVPSWPHEAPYGDICVAPFRSAIIVPFATRKHEPIISRTAVAGVKIVREKSVAGPCITLGVVLRETASRITYRDRHGEQKFISKRWPVHSEPCPSCPDPKAKYPDD
jgi:hypothetical protein